MILEIKIPSPGESITEVEISSWLVNDGDYVEKDQLIAEIDSDKATLELSAEESGIITLKAETDEVIKVGSVICLIDTSVQKTETNEVKKEAEFNNEEPLKSDRFSEIKLSPVAKKILEKENINPKSVLGISKNRKITKQDAINAISLNKLNNSNRNFSRKKLSMLRRKVSQRLVSVKNETAMLTTFNEVDMQAIFEIRKKYKEVFKEKHGVNLGFMSFFTKAVTRALQMYPDINSMIDGDYKVEFDYQDISIAVSSDKGLMVPVIRNTEKLTFKEIEGEVAKLAIKAREGKLTIDEMTGGTFTITNGGVFGSMLSTPILNPPQSAILGMHNIVERPVAINGKVEIRPMMYVALSYDHRIIDGRESVGFLVAVKEAIENPVEILMNDDVEKALEI